MKKEFSKSWKSSKQPRKQRKYRANAPLHIRRKFVGINLSKDLRKKHSIRNIVVRVGDLVKIMRGKFKLKQGKIMDGSKSNVKMQPSNLQIIELNLQDSKRLKNSIKEIKTDKESSKKIEEKDEKIKTTKKEVSKETNKENKK